MLDSMFILFFIFNVVLLFLALFYKRDPDLQLIFSLMGFIFATIMCYSSLSIEVTYLPTGATSLQTYVYTDYAFLGIGFIMSIILFFNTAMLVFMRFTRITSVDVDNLGMED